MPEINLMQSEADALLAMEKHRLDDACYDFPPPGDSLNILLQSPDHREQFLLDIRKRQIDLLRGTCQNRARNVVVLARLDFGGPPHRNPDDLDVPCPHLHIYRKGFGDNWAVPLPPDRFSCPDDHWKLFQDFIVYCNITEPPIIQGELFS